MIEGLPPNNASHMLRLDCDEKRARAVADLIVETFDPTETAAAAFELDGGPQWSLEVYFADAPDEALILCGAARTWPPRRPTRSASPRRG